LAACVGCRLWLRHRPLPRLHDPAGELRRLAGLAAVSVLTCVALISPVLVGLAVRLFNERLPDTAILWRSSPRGLDLLAYVVPNPIHPLFGMQTRSWFMPPYPDAFPEFIGSFSIAAFVVLIVAARSGALPRLWVTFTAFFIALSLGPFVHVAGVNTYVPGPWAVLRYIPIVGAARSPARFVIVAMLGLAILCGFAIEALCRRRTAAAWKPLAAIVAVIAFELLPAPRPIYSAAIPNVYRLVAEGNGEPGRLLDLPTGIRDGTSSIGNFTAANEFFQTGHRRPLIGGYLSRVSTWRKRENARSPMLHVLFALSEGQPVAAEKLERARLARDAFLRRSCVRFVVIDKVRASSALRAFAEQALRLSLTYEDATHALFAPIDPPACAAPQRD
jgi:hypothetical protein